MNCIPVIDLTATGVNITRLRIDAGFTVKDIQDIFGFSTPQAIYKWQRGTALPTVDNLAVLAALFGVKIDDILVFQNSGSVRIFA
jgi:transcriptional regulator with XRE-family HTH domain